MQKEKILKDAVLVLVVKDGKISLAIKRRGIGISCWNAYGGGPEDEDLNSLENTAVRELFEECGVVTTSENLEKVAILYFRNRTEDGVRFICTVHVYITRIFSGEPHETETSEMLTPTWFETSKLPLDNMMLADRVWLPLVLSGKKIIADASYGPRQQTLEEEVEIEEVRTFAAA